MKIYTKTGDDGTTGLLASGRVPKDSDRIEAYGTVDELNAVLGVARAELARGPAPAVELDAPLASIQDDLFAVGSALADPTPGGRFHDLITDDHAARLEAIIDRLDAELPPLAQFILPGGTPAAAQVHLARTVCRRAERLAIRLGRQAGEDVPPGVIVYLNRLSDLLFVLARAINRRSGVEDTPWNGL